MTLYKELRNEMENHKEFWNYYNKIPMMLKYCEDCM